MGMRAMWTRPHVCVCFVERMRMGFCGLSWLFEVQTGAVAWWVSSSRRSLRIRKCGHTPCAKANQPVAWTQDDLEVADDYDGILVLGGGFKSDGTLNMWSQRRLDASVDLQKLQVKPCPIVCLGMVDTLTE